MAEDAQGGVAMSTIELQRRRARRTAIGLLLLAFAIYAGFILLSVRRAHP